MESGILEQYVLGLTSADENLQVEQMAALHPEISAEIAEISIALEAYATAHAVQPSALIKPLLLAAIDYVERIKNGEPISSPPLLRPESRMEDYAPWLNRKDMAMPATAENIFARIIGYSEEAMMAVVWVRCSTPAEVHTNEYESFLILEGSCIFTLGTEQRQLKAGDFLAVPLHIRHHVEVTSAVPCKVLLQRRAA